MFKAALARRRARTLGAYRAAELDNKVLALALSRNVVLIRRCRLVAAGPVEVMPGTVQDECSICGEQIWICLLQQGDPAGERLLCTLCTDIYVALHHHLTGRAPRVRPAVMAP